MFIYGTPTGLFSLKNLRNGTIYYIQIGDCIYMIKFNLAKILEEKDLPQRYLVKEWGMRSGTVNAYYHNFIKRIRIEDLNTMCEALDCTLDELMEYVPDEK